MFTCISYKKNIKKIDFGRHHVPINFMLLAAFTVVEAVTVGVAVSMYEAEVVVKAFFMTLLITGGLTAYTFQTKRDFTNIGSG